MEVPMISPIFTLILALLLQGNGPKDLQVPTDAKVQPPLVLPAGTTIPVALSHRLSTKTAKDGDGIYAKTILPITVNDTIVIPEGSTVKGKILEAKRPGRVKGQASLQVSFQTLVFPNGVTMPLYASLGGSTGEGTREGEATIKGESSKGNDAATIGTGAATGGLIGILGGRRGVGVGAAAGAAGGLAAVL